MAAPSHALPRPSFRCLLVALLAFAHPREVTAAEPRPIRFTQFTTPQGLSQSTVNAITQDRQGFLWFGTQDGLNRFDGSHFTVYRSIPTDTSSVSDNYIWSLLRGRDGKIWVGTLNAGLNCYDPERDRFLRFRHDTARAGSLSGNNITALCEDSDGALWVGTWGAGLNRLDRGKGSFALFRHESENPNSLSSNFIRCIIQDRTGLLWIGTWSGLVSLDKRSGTFTRYRHDPGDRTSFSGDRVLSLLEDPSGSIWVGTQGDGLNRFDPRTGTFACYRHDPSDPATLSDNTPVSLCSDGSGGLWIATASGGLDRFDTNLGRFRSYRREIGDPASLPSDRLSSIHRDSTGILWIGSMDAGVICSDPIQARFVNIRAIAGDPRAITSPSVRAIREDRTGALWIGTTGGGLDRARRGEGPFTHFRHDPRDPQSLSTNAVLSIYEDRGGGLWIGTEDGGLDFYDRPRRRFIHYRHDPHDARSLSGNSVMTVLETLDGALWVGTTGNGLDRLNRKTGFVDLVLLGSDRSNGTSGSSVWAIHEDREGFLWLGTWNEGLKRYDRASGTFRHYRHEPGNPASLSNNTVWCIQEDADGNLWLGTWGGGLVRYNRFADTFEHFGESDGLANNVVYGILPDRHGNLWLSTNKGVSKFTPSSRTFRNFDERDGLQGDEFNQGAFWRGRDGMIYFGGVNGLTAFDPDSIHVNSHIPPVVITSFRLFDRPVQLERAIWSTDEISLSSQEDFLSFEFAALSFSAPGKNQYAYRLEGFDNDWVQCGTRRYAAYTHLNPGAYVFRVRGSNNDGVWNYAGASIRLVVRPPFWMTWWFLLSGLGLVGLTILGLHRYRVKRLLELERLRTRIAADLHDELASNLSSIAMFSKIVSDTSATKGSIPPEQTLLLDRITSLSQDSISSIRDIIWAIDPKPGTVYDLLMKLRDTALPACRARNIALTCAEPLREALPGSNLSPEQRRNLWLLLKEAVSNAVRHAGCTELSIDHSFASGILTVRVRDNGSGFVAPATSDGKGMGTMKMRAGQLGGVLAVRSDAGAGTTVEVKVPL